MALAFEKCVACRPGSPEITDLEISDLMPQIPKWRLVQDAGARKLERQFTFRDFQKPMELANRIACASEREGHHPRIIVEWGSLTISWSTYAIGGLHRNDFIMASKTDKLFDESH